MSGASRRTRTRVRKKGTRDFDLSGSSRPVRPSSPNTCSEETLVSSLVALVLWGNACGTRRIPNPLWPVSFIAGDHLSADMCLYACQRVDAKWRSFEIRPHEEAGTRLLLWCFHTRMHKTNTFRINSWGVNLAWIHVGPVFALAQIQENKFKEFLLKYVFAHSQICIHTFALPVCMNTVSVFTHPDANAMFGACIGTRANAGNKSWRIIYVLVSCQGVCMFDWGVCVSESYQFEVRLVSSFDALAVTSCICTFLCLFRSQRTKGMKIPEDPKETPIELPRIDHKRTPSFAEEKWNRKIGAPTKQQ